MGNLSLAPIGIASFKLCTMSGQAPINPNIYHIVHFDRLRSIIETGGLVSDTQALRAALPGTTIGISGIKERRRAIELQSHRKLKVGECVPFYFCPRSIMLYILHRANHPDLIFRGGQSSIVHLVADLRRTVDWAERCGRRWAFTDSNAGSYYFEDYANLRDLNKIDWGAVRANNWESCREKKQAEFLLEKRFPWHLVDRIGVMSQRAYNEVHAMLEIARHRPSIRIMPAWYY